MDRSFPVGTKDARAMELQCKGSGVNSLCSAHLCENNKPRGTASGRGSGGAGRVPSWRYVGGPDPGVPPMPCKGAQPLFRGAGERLRTWGRGRQGVGPSGASRKAGRPTRRQLRQSAEAAAPLPQHGSARPLPLAGGKMGRPEARAGGRRQLQRGQGGEGALLAAPTQGSKVRTATVPALSSRDPRPPVLTGL